MTSTCPVLRVPGQRTDAPCPRCGDLLARHRAEPDPASRAPRAAAAAYDWAVKADELYRLAWQADRVAQDLTGRDGLEDALAAMDAEQTDARRRADEAVRLSLMWSAVARVAGEAGR